MLAAILTTLALFAGCTNESPPPSRAPASSDAPPVVPSALRPDWEPAPDDGQWTMPARDYASTRFSNQTEINTGNVGNLTLAWTFTTGVTKGHEAAPIVSGDTMYVVAPYPNTLFALDLTKPHAPLRWKYDPKPEPAAQGVACCDVVNRGGTLSNGRFFYATLDGYALAIDAATGAEAWKTKLGDINQGETITMAPLVVGDKVLVGNSGGEMGVRGWLTALHVSDGSVAWRAYNTGPDADCLIGDEFKPFYASDRGKDLGVTSWPPGAWKIGGGTVWGWISYDAETNSIFYGTANPGPWNAEQRPGDNKWTCGIWSRDADTGQARWFYQFSPHDLYDWDAVNEQILVDLDIRGSRRKVLIRPERNGYVYVMDRNSGEVLSATAFVPNTATTGVNLETGALEHVEEMKPVLGKVVRDICPSSSGAKDWNPSAWSPKTRLLYIPHNNLCMDYEALEANYIAGTPYLGAEARFRPGHGGHRGAFTAWDPVAARPAWRIDEDLPVWSGAVATAGDVVFYGTMDGWFKAVDANDGRLLWKYKTSSGIIGQPITYRAPDGKQYVAVLSGVGGWAGAIVSNDLDPRDQSAALGFANAMQDLPGRTQKGGTLYAFALP
jgi:PQQ-dependent dehydrogenase (methanol/ethanol family)